MEQGIIRRLSGNYQAAIRELNPLIRLSLGISTRSDLFLRLRGKSELRSLFCPVQRQPTAAELLDGQISRIMPVEDGFDNIRCQECAAHAPAKVFLVEVKLL